MSKKVVIVGAGPCGLLLAHYLLHRGENYQIEIYERRSDPRIISFSKARTFPISLNERGMSALRQIAGLEAAVKAVSVKMTGTVFHQKNGKSRFTPRQKPLVTLDRTNLVIVLLEKLAQEYDTERLNIHFDCQCQSVDFHHKTVNFYNIAVGNNPEFTVDYDLLIGTDGANSVVRAGFQDIENFEYEQKYYPTDYKSIFLDQPVNSSSNLKLDHIHTWRLNDGTLMVALHQADGTISGAINFPRDKNQIIGLATPEQVLQFFCENFPEIGSMMTEKAAKDFLDRPIAKLLTVRCNQYHDGDSVLIMGDAAHAVSSSIGQGCNAALEDTMIFDQILNKFDDNLAAALPEFTKRRQPDGYALVELGDYAFPSSTGLFIEFILREYLAKIKHRVLPNVFPPSLIDMIFETTLPYSEILQTYQNWISKMKKKTQNN